MTMTSMKETFGHSALLIEIEVQFQISLSRIYHVKLFTQTKKCLQYIVMLYSTFFIIAENYSVEWKALIARIPEELLSSCV